MDRFEYAMGLISLLVGLGLADIAISTHRLIKLRSSRWDTLAVAVAVYIAFTIVRLWYDIWAIRGNPDATGFWFYISLIAEVFVLFLLAAAALPFDEKEETDLKVYYAGHQRYIWSLFALFQLSYLGHWLYFLGARNAVTLTGAAWVLAPLAIYVAMIFIRNRRVQAGLLGLVFAAYVIETWGFRL
jgi:hypothetical protein